MKQMDTPLAYTIAEACEIARAGKTALYQAITAGSLRAVKRGRKTLVLAADLKAWLEGLPPVRPTSSRRIDTDIASPRPRGR